jgi:aminoglycoside phosphotransferase (APT) family kinase protein
LTFSLAEHLSLYILSRYPEAVVSDVNFLVSGFESEIYTFHLQGSHSSPKNYILRLFTGEGATEKLTREARGLSRLQNGGYPVPELLLQETDSRILGKPFEIVERLEGQGLWPVLAVAEPHRQEQLLSRFGSLLAGLHQLDWRSFSEKPAVYEKSPGLLLDETISCYRSLYTKYNLKGFLQLTDWLDAHKNEISVYPAVVHQDFHANNVFLCPEDRLVVIDWTQFAVSDYRIDLCWTLLIMGDFGNPGWGRQILHAYASHFKHPMEHMDYFHVVVSMKLLASTVISFLFSPEELGLRSETVNVTKEQVSIYKQLSQRIRTITGLRVPELEAVLEGISEGGGTNHG